MATKSFNLNERLMKSTLKHHKLREHQLLEFYMKLEIKNEIYN